MMGGVGGVSTIGMYSHISNDSVSRNVYVHQISRWKGLRQAFLTRDSVFPSQTLVRCCCFKNQNIQICCGVTYLWKCESFNSVLLASVSSFGLNQPFAGRDEFGLCHGWMDGWRDNIRFDNGPSTSISNSLDGSRGYYIQLTVHVRIRLPSIPRIMSEVSLEFEGQQLR